MENKNWKEFKWKDFIFFILVTLQEVTKKVKISFSLLKMERTYFPLIYRKPKKDIPLAFHFQPSSSTLFSSSDETTNGSGNSHPLLFLRRNHEWQQWEQSSSLPQTKSRMAAMGTITGSFIHLKVSFRGRRVF